jgi:hypothetical protein
MARPSKLTDRQWEEIKSRMLKGEKAADLSREYGVSKTSISERLSKRVETMKAVSNQLVSAEQNLKALPVSEQVTVLNFVDDLKAISLNLASAGKFGAINANRLSELANSQLGTVNEETLMTGEGMVALKLVGALQDLANEASKVPLGLLNANKDQVVKLNNPQHSDLQGMTDEELFAIASRGS